MNFLEDFDPLSNPKTARKRKGSINNISRLHFESIKNKKPVFSYQYISLDRTDFCFDNPDISSDDFVELFKIKKILCSTTFDLIKPVSEFHFHGLIFKKKKHNYFKTYLEEIIKKEAKTDKYDIPEVYQFAVYTKPEKIVKGINTEKSPRIFGFLGKEGIFYIIWIDLYHNILSNRNINIKSKK